MHATHEIPASFMSALLQGCLQPILQAVHADDTLMLGLRGPYVSIYYRGGELLKIDGRASGGYRITANADYGHSQDHVDRTIATATQAQDLVLSLPIMKWAMDCHPKIRSSHEREFQQLVVRENNRSRSAGSSDYFITDMEHASGDARFDMLGARWSHRDRKHRDRLMPVIFEMKYGESALGGSAGIDKHIEDLRLRLSDSQFVANLKANVASQFNQLTELELIEFNGSESNKKFTSCDQLRIVLVLAAFNPRSSKLLPILQDLHEQWQASPIPNTDLRVFHASFCGYLMHENSMLDLPATIDQLKRWQSA